MFKKLGKKMNDQRGVTLIELLAVIVILAIVAAVATPIVINQIQGADVAADDANASMIQDATSRAILLGDVAIPATNTTYALGVGANQLNLVGIGYINEIPVVQSITGGAFSVTITTTGIVTVNYS